MFGKKNQYTLCPKKTGHEYYGE